MERKSIYRSRIGWEIWGPTILLFGFIIFKTNGVWPVVILLLLMSWSLATMIHKTQYVISGDKLHIRCWPVLKLEIDINTIHRIQKTWSPLASPATSYIGRIEILYGLGKSCIISPMDKERFVRDLLARNKSIIVTPMART